MKGPPGKLAGLGQTTARQPAQRLQKGGNHRRATMATELVVGWPVLYLVVAGLALSLSIASYYLALSRGPVTVVAPIFALSFAVASVLGIIFLGEEIKLTRVLGLALAAGSIFLLAR